MIQHNLPRLHLGSFRRKHVLSTSYPRQKTLSRFPLQPSAFCLSSSSRLYPIAPCPVQQNNQFTIYRGSTELALELHFLGSMDTDWLPFDVPLSKAPPWSADQSALPFFRPGTPIRYFRKNISELDHWNLAAFGSIFYRIKREKYHEKTQ